MIILGVSILLVTHNRGAPTVCYRCVEEGGAVKDQETGRGVRGRVKRRRG